MQYVARRWAAIDIAVNVCKSLGTGAVMEEWNEAGRPRVSILSCRAFTRPNRTAGIDGDPDISVASYIERLAAT